jgi:endonuclease YncB( thermonuclease family)
MGFIDPIPDTIFSLDGIHVPVRIIRIYDGDTLWVAFRVWWSVGQKPPRGQQWYHVCVRTLGYDSPEIRQPRSLSEDVRRERKQKAYAARDALSEFTKGEIYATFGKWDKYGRALATLYRMGPDGLEDINEQMVQQGYGVPYFGGTKQS